MMSSAAVRIATASALILVPARAYADSTGFQGFFAPGTWGVGGSGIGGSSAVFAPDGSELKLIGSDGGAGSTIEVIHSVTADGIWSFHWTYICTDPTAGFDAAYYTIQGLEFGLSDDVGMLVSGDVSVYVTAGQIIGWGVQSVDGLFGPGILTITDFRAPVPAPAAFALLGLAAMTRARRRR